ncbi:conserved unknown protein [Ectocarpus siliculosus]|uniref:Ubiquitin carboxyl-terminal hydrolase 7 ICP0-binding domain-containing protein n=1 Tax=Ectocarpus siliculosus TaxID=2880 RepID=D8LQ04_ECTSI|nr:conserved unknown protein [Ectocarpus siliculosus]|eukprot:CBN74896.1 conserved unknown protein [Ectocarpus siliculosus]
MAQRNIFIDPQGFVRISVKIIDVREAYFRVATDVDLARSVTGRGGGGDFADWRTCLPAKSFKHDQLLYVIQKVSELTGVPLVSCRPWLCMPRKNRNGPPGPLRPAAALLPQHLQMSICEILAAHAATKQDQPPLSIHYPPVVSGSNEPEFVFVGKAMAHRTDRGCELVPIALSLAHLPEGLNLEVFEQITPEEVRRFNGDKTVAEAGLSHGSILLFRSAQQETTPSPSPPQQTAAAAPPPQEQQATPPQQQQQQPKQEEQQPAVTVPPASTVSSVVPFNTAAAAAAAAAMAAHATVTHAPKPAFPPARSGRIEDAVAAAASAATSSGPTATAGGGGGGGGKGEKSAPGWDGGPAAVVGRVASPPGEIPVVMDPAAQRRATCLALFQVQENQRQHQAKEAARAVAKKLAAEAVLTSAKEKLKKIATSSSSSAAAAAAATASDKTADGESKAAAAAAAAAAAEAPPPQFLTPAQQAEVAAAARMAAHAAAVEHAQSKAQAYRTVSIMEALREGAPPMSTPPPAQLQPSAPAMGSVVAQQAAVAAAAAASARVSAPPPAAVPARVPAASGEGTDGKAGGVSSGGDDKLAGKGTGVDGGSTGSATTTTASAPAGEGGGGSRKSAKTTDARGGGGGEEAAPAASPAPSADLASFIAQLMHVPGFTMEKCMELTRSKERAEIAAGSSDKAIRVWDLATGVALALFKGHKDDVESIDFSAIASAIKTISHDEKDSFRSRQLERLLAIKEKETSTDGDGDDGGD